jgi:RNA polymerase sigma factor (sigma-70 family)
MTIAQKTEIVKTVIQVAPSDYKRLTDEELVHRFVHRNEKITVNYLFDRYAHLVFGICMKHFADATLATEATNELFISLLDDMGKYNIEKFKPWFFQYVKKYCLLKANNSVQIANNEIVLDIEMTFEDAVALDAKTTARLESELKNLNKDERVLIELFYKKGMTYSQIAATTTRPKQQVKQLLQKAKAHLKENVMQVK